MILYAPNVHQGGGRTLLLALLDVLEEQNELIVFLDKRLDLPSKISLRNANIFRISPNVFSRLKAELDLRRLAVSGEDVLSFGNLPPLLPNHAVVRCFVQNRYLVEPVSLRAMCLRVRCRIWIERYWLRWCRNFVNTFIVQTPSMKCALQLSLGVDPCVLPFLASYSGCIERKISASRDWKSINFLYVASGEPHKNHRNLIEAWCLLAQEGLFPRLIITLDPRLAPKLDSWINSVVGRNNLVVESRQVVAEDIQALYRSSDVLIYPSMFESLGIPLIEAKSEGLFVLASELDYIRDVLDPDESFDPTSPVSIARAVKRFLGKSEKSLPLMDARQFLDNLGMLGS